ncbi:hypothetical protein EX30DRAFT_112656 [Ascodesmis nigricans]|uniref:BTB domain-containing protein n=1 Tax=Ascodesmis nigricans TaxID=341454 RepID=A0A4S2MQ83_9PEZI|nr:hypothetical protein EX30DRAFT_112656 [Ascodesmis nigricans]
MPDATTTTTTISMARKLSSLFNSPIHSDITIYAGTLPISAHLAILSLHTPFFTSALSPASAFEEATTCSVKFPEHSPHAVYRLVRFCYEGSYPAGELRELAGVVVEGEDKEGTEGGWAHLRVYLMADYVGVEELMTLATENLRGELSRPEKMEMGELGRLVEAVYAITGARKKDRVLREVFVEAVLRRVVQGEEVDGLREVLERQGELAVEVLGRYVKLMRRRMEGEEREAERVMDELLREKAEVTRLTTEVETMRPRLRIQRTIIR